MVGFYVGIFFSIIDCMVSSFALQLCKPVHAGISQCGSSFAVSIICRCLQLLKLYTRLSST